MASAPFGLTDPHASSRSPSSGRRAADLDTLRRTVTKRRRLPRSCSKLQDRHSRRPRRCVPPCIALSIPIWIWRTSAQQGGAQATSFLATPSRSPSGPAGGVPPAPPAVIPEGTPASGSSGSAALLGVTLGPRMRQLSRLRTTNETASPRSLRSPSERDRAPRENLFGFEFYSWRKKES